MNHLLHFTYVSMIVFALKIKAGEHFIDKIFRGGTENSALN